MNVKDLLTKEYNEAPNKAEYLNEIREHLFSISDWKHNPVELVRWVPMDAVQANNYNPNKVAHNELRLLHTSISHDGYTQPIVTIFDKELKKYVIVDGFHRYFVEKTSEDLFKINKGMLPITVIDKGVNDRMASTIRHNRARGKHSVAGMSNVVFNLLDNGWSDEAICREIGLEKEELLRLKHITGFSKLFENVEYKKAWETKKQIQLKKEAHDGNKNNKTGV